MLYSPLPNDSRIGQMAIMILENIELWSKTQPDDIQDIVNLYHRMLWGMFLAIEYPVTSQF